MVPFLFLKENEKGYLFSLQNRERMVSFFTGDQTITGMCNLVTNYNFVTLAACIPRAPSVKS